MSNSPAPLSQELAQLRAIPDGTSLVTANQNLENGFPAVIELPVEGGAPQRARNIQQARAAATQ